MTVKNSYRKLEEESSLDSSVHFPEKARNILTDFQFELGLSYANRHPRVASWWSDQLQPARLLVKLFHQNRLESMSFETAISWCRFWNISWNCPVDVICSVRTQFSSNSFSSFGSTLCHICFNVSIRSFELSISKFYVLIVSIDYEFWQIGFSEES